ncbi:MAG: hypothetical protein ABIH78_04120 [Candidatus Peregrinibacteria bacterium]
MEFKDPEQIGWDDDSGEISVGEDSRTTPQKVLEEVAEEARALGLHVIEDSQLESARFHLGLVEPQHEPKETRLKIELSKALSEVYTDLQAMAGEAIENKIDPALIDLIKATINLPEVEGQVILPDDENTLKELTRMLSGELLPNLERELLREIEEHKSLWKRFFGGKGTAAILEDFCGRSRKMRLNISRILQNGRPRKVTLTGVRLKDLRKQ